MKPSWKESRKVIMERMVEGTRAILLGVVKKTTSVREVAPSNYFQLSAELVDLMCMTPKA